MAPSSLPTTSAAMTVDSWHTPSHSPDADPSWTKGVGLEHHNLVSPHDRLDTRWVGGRSERSRGDRIMKGGASNPRPRPVLGIVRNSIGDARPNRAPDWSPS